MSYRAAQQSEKDLDFVWNESSCHGGPLHRAVLHNSLTKVKELVESSKTPSNTVRSQFSFEDHETGEEGRAEAVHIAASRGHLEIMKYLLDKKADPAAKVVVSGRPKYDVLHAAVLGEGRGGRVDMVDFLYGVTSPTVDSEGRSLIHIAFLTGSREIIEYLRSRNSDLKHMHSFRQTPREQMETGVHQPLSFGILGGQMSEDLLSEMAQPTAGSLKIFIEECPQCIPAFLDRITSEEENITATEIARHLTAIDVAKVLRESPEAALALLRASTTEPECGNSGWHALPTRVSFADRDWMQTIRTMFNPVRHMLTFYVDEVTWKFDSNRFEHPEWHKYITNREFGRPVLDAEIQVCHVQDILCAEVFGAMCTEENVESELMADDNLIRAAVRHVFWNGCCRVDLTTVLLNFWGLGLLIAEEALMYDADLAAEVMPTTRMGKGRRLFHGHGTVGATGTTYRGNLLSGFLDGVMNEGEDPRVDAWIAISWIGAKGVIDAWQHHSYDVTLDFSMPTFSVNVRPDTSCEDEGVPKEPTAVGIGSSVTLSFYATHAESRKRQAYHLQVQRLLGSETSLQNLEVEHGKLTPFPFSPEVRIYRVMLDLEMDLVNVRYRLRDNEQRLRVAAKPEEMLGGSSPSRRLGAVLERQEALHSVSGEVQYVDSSSSFMLDVGYAREVTLTIQCADPTQASIGTYTLRVERGNCPEERPYLEPLKRKCVNFCPEGFYRNDLDRRCSRCNTNCQVCTGLLHCKMCLPDDVQFTYVIQPDGKCEAQTNHLYARYKWWCAGFGILLFFLASFGCAGICTWCHAGPSRSSSGIFRRQKQARQATLLRG